MWSAWDIDLFTVGWIIWMVFFLVWETVGIITGAENTLTYHLRPVFIFTPITWFVAVGLWLWMGFHFFIEAGNPITEDTL